MDTSGSYMVGEVREFADLLVDFDVPFTIALTGSVARGEDRRGLGKWDYQSDVDLLCIVRGEYFEVLMEAKAQSKRTCPLILMTYESLVRPSNAVLSISKEIVFGNDDFFCLPHHISVSAEEYMSYQAQPLAYYAAKLRMSDEKLYRRLYAKIAITCIKLIYLSGDLKRKSFVYESELAAHCFSGVDRELVRKIVNRNIEDTSWEGVSKYVQGLVFENQVITDLASNLESTEVFFSTRGHDTDSVVESVFRENNGMSRSDALFGASYV